MQKLSVEDSTLFQDLKPEPFGKIFSKALHTPESYNWYEQMKKEMGAIKFLLELYDKDFFSHVDDIKRNLLPYEFYVVVAVNPMYSPPAIVHLQELNYRVFLYSQIINHRFLVPFIYYEKSLSNRMELVKDKIAIVLTDVPDISGVENFERIAIPNRLEDRIVEMGITLAHVPQEVAGEFLIYEGHEELSKNRLYRYLRNYTRFCRKRTPNVNVYGLGIEVPEI